MATATVLSAMFLQKQQGGSAPLFASRSFFARFVSPNCCPIGPLCSIPHHASLHRLEGDAEAPRKAPSRRDAIGVILQVSLLCAHNSNAQAAESGFLRMEGFEHVQLRKELEASSHLAYQGIQESSGSSLGFLGCLVFGFLFLKEKHTRAAKDASLEDVQLRIKKAEAELCSQTRSSVQYKLEESHLKNGDRRDTSLDEALQRQLVNVKSSVIERGKQLDVNKHLTKSLRQQATGLAASIKELEKDCRSLTGDVDRQLDFRLELEAELQRMDLDLQCRAKEISSLKVAVEDQEQAYNEMVQEHVVVKSSLDKSSKKVLDVEIKVESLQSSLLATAGFAKALADEYNISVTRNEKLKGKLHELLRSLQHERATFIKHLTEHNELLSLKGRDVDTQSAELVREQGELERNVRMVSQLTSERDEFMMVVSEERAKLDGLMEMLNLNEERLRIFETELATLHQQLLHEQAQSTTSESNLGNDMVLRQLLNVSSEVENQINAERKLTERLKKEFHITREGLSSSEVKVLALQESVQSILSSQAQLQEDLARLSEAQQACSQALKKEKRAATYAKKKLASCKEIMMEESRVVGELRNDLEKARRLVEDSKEQISYHSKKLKRATETAACLTDDVFSLTAALKDEQTLQMNLGGSDEVTSIGKPLPRGHISKQTTPKIRKNLKKSSVLTGSLSSVNENGKAGVDGHLSSSIAG